MASTLDMTLVGSEGERESKGNQKRQPREKGPREEDKREGAWLKWLRSWGREAHELEKFRVGME